jgi:hypothetical protein
MDMAASPVLDDADAGRRKALLAGLQAALAESGTRSVLVGNHRLVLRSNDAQLHGASGRTNPALHVLDPSNVVTTDGSSYRLRDGREFPISDRAAVADAIRVSMVEVEE